MAIKVDDHGENTGLGSTARVWEGDDYAVWPDGWYGNLSDVWDGHYDDRSDDYEMVAADDIARLTELGLAEEFGLLNT